MNFVATVLFNQMHVLGLRFHNPHALDTHYDSVCFNSLNTNYATCARDRSYAFNDISDAGFAALRARVLVDRQIAAPEPAPDTASR